MSSSPRKPPIIDWSKRSLRGIILKKTIFILIVIIFSLLYYLGVLTRKETLPLSKEFFSAETPPHRQASGLQRDRVFKIQDVDRKLLS